MLTIAGSQGETFCDGISRRGFLKIGTLGLGGATLPQILQAESTTRHKPLDHKAVIMIFLAGGPPHQDMWDLKMDAPSAVRGEFKPISTNVDGIQIGELFPQMARMMDKFTVIRSMVGASGGHDGQGFQRSPGGVLGCLGPGASRERCQQHRRQHARQDPTTTGHLATPFWGEVSRPV